MNLISWNCRGSGGPAIVPIIRRYLRSTGAELAFLSETKCSRNKAEQCIARLPLTNAEIVPSVGRGGGLWLLWSDDISVEVLESCSYFIIAKIQQKPTTQPWILCGVYGDCDDRNNGFI